MKQLVLFRTAFLVLALLLVACGGKNIATDLPGGGIVYNKYNIHAVNNRGALRASFTNWVGLDNKKVIFPPNTQFQVGYWENGFLLTKVDTGEQVYYELSARHVDIAPNEYIQLITSPKKVSQDNLSELDKKGIAEGRAIKGMSKDGVLIALGYPSPHRTPSLHNNVWVYWRTRMATTTVTFGADGKAEIVP